MGVSACMIVWNEEEMLENALYYLTSLTQVTEICVVVDKASTDETLRMIVEYDKLTGSKPIVFSVRELDNFGNQKNAVLDLASEPWILLMDADETYSQALDTLLKDIQDKPQIHAVRIPTLVTYPDRKHFIKHGHPDPHIRVWKRGFAKYQGEVHEVLIDVFGRNLHLANNNDILNTWQVPEYQNVVMKHHQYLKSDDLLLSKGERWERFFEGSAKEGIPLDKEFWIRRKYHESKILPIAELPRELWDVTTE